MTKISIFAALCLAVTAVSFSAQASLEHKLTGSWHKTGEQCLKTKSPLGTPQSAQNLSLAVKNQAGTFVVETQITAQCFMTETSDVKIKDGIMITMNKVTSYSQPCNKAVIDVVDQTVHVVHYQVKGRTLTTNVSILGDDEACAKGDSLITTYTKN